MNINEYKPKHFKSWQDYRKWQHIADLIGGGVCTIVAVAALYCCGG